MYMYMILKTNTKISCLVNMNTHQNKHIGTFFMHELF